MALIKCTECENEVRDKALSCPKCGAPIEKNTAPEVKAQSNKSERVTITDVKKEKKSPWRIITPLLVLFLVLILFAIV